MKQFFSVFIALWLLSTSVWADELPDLGASAALTLSESDAAKLGKKMMMEIARSGKMLDDPLANYYLQSLGNKLVAAVGTPQAPIRFFWVKDPAINAFALPGNYIGVHTGLLHYATSESELAAVMAHEIAHVAQHHIARMMEQAKNMQLPMIAAMLGAAILGAHNPNAASGALAATMAGANQMAINFTRTHEAEADHIGIGILARAGFNPNSMADFFERSARASRYEEDIVPDFLNTHPVSDVRIADARARARFYRQKLPQESLNYKLIQARLWVLVGNNGENKVRYFADQLKIEPSNAAAHYGHALALLENVEAKAAQIEIKALLKQDPDELIYALALADCDIALQDIRGALAILSQFKAIYPENPPLLQAYTEALLLPKAPSGSPARAVQILETYLENHSNVTTPYLWLAKATAAADEESESHQAMATFYEKVGNILQAVTQLKIALRMSKDNYDTLRIKARLKALTPLLEREQRNE
jgi:beta-barrel assembly-enhancing protease